MSLKIQNDNASLKIQNDNVSLKIQNDNVSLKIQNDNVSLKMFKNLQNIFKISYLVACLPLSRSARIKKRVWNTLQNFHQGKIQIYY